MNYQRIQPFPKELHYDPSELRALASVWNDKREQLHSHGVYQEFIKSLKREWAIETGIIERLYTWDRGVTQVLIEQGIESSIISHQGNISRQEAEHIKTLIDDHVGIIDRLFGYVKGEEPLSEYFIRGLHAEFTTHQDYVDAITDTGTLLQIELKKGEYKTLPNNPRRPDGIIHEYCPPEFTKEEMENLISMYREADNLYPVELKSAWLHHRFTQIHPFQDGNGRVARALASLVFLHEGMFPLVVRESDRREYIGALESADNGDLTVLVSFFARRQRDAILKALGLEQQVQQSKYADQIIISAIEILKTRFSEKQQKISVVYEHAEKLFCLTEKTFKKIAKTINTQLREVTPPERQIPYNARENSAENSSQYRHYFQKQIVDIANTLEYFANLERYRSWVRLTLTTDQEFDYVVSFHGYGSRDTGILAASAFSYFKAPREDNVTEAVNVYPAAMELFQFNYMESFESTAKRFNEWLEHSIALALAEWKRAL